MDHKRFMLLCTAFLVAYAPLSCFPPERVLFNGDKKAFQRNGCRVKIACDNFRGRGRIIGFGLVALDEEVQITDIDKWFVELSEANEVNFHAVRRDDRYVSENSISLKNNERFWFSMEVKEIFRKRKTRFVFPKSEHVSCLGRTLFLEQIDYILEQ